MITALEVAVLSRTRLTRQVGQAHHKATLSDAQVARIRELHSEWVARGSPRWPRDESRGYENLGRMFRCSWVTVRDICKYRTRKQGTPSRSRA